MELEAYRAFTAALLAAVEGRPGVIGLVALGSMAEEPILPDRWSDHDFFLVTEPGAQEPFRTGQSWLPDAAGIVLAFRETAHGVKVLYRSGHLLELAVFDLAELHLARVNRYRVLLDRGGVADHMRAVRATTARWTEESAPADAFLLGQLLAALLVGAGRWRRGERLAGIHLVNDVAAGHLVRLLRRHLPPDAPLLDDLDPLRRFEAASPRLGAELAAALLLPADRAAAALLGLAERELGARVTAFPAGAFATVTAWLSAGR